MPEISIQDIINIWTPEPQWILQEHKLIQGQKSQSQSGQINLKCVKTGEHLKCTQRKGIEMKLRLVLSQVSITKHSIKQTNESYLSD